ncbi:hypothetical protein CEXT_272791 [Caerostris extrusa]|uniref:Uncharacterized protein n=1 Tax=Caerostris extrusa TaxID=172846 RepID=A0AAV4MC14_CAEEX|nr:hypothetical protein CEXT_272791 [Caerostris extrusa]
MVFRRTEVLNSEEEGNEDSNERDVMFFRMTWLRKVIELEEGNENSIERTSLLQANYRPKGYLDSLERHDHHSLTSFSPFCSWTYTNWGSIPFEKIRPLINRQILRNRMRDLIAFP